MPRGSSSAGAPLLFVAAILAAGPAHAAFHLAHIAEVNARAGDDPADQYVEIVMEAAGQTIVKNSVLAAWDCDGTFLGDLLIVPDNIANGGTDVRWIMATMSSTGGIIPDFVIPADGPDIPADCGQVCWGAPGLVPPMDTGWDRNDLDTNFVDCVAYGPYTGPTRTGSGSPSAFTPGDGTYALVRVSDTALTPECPSPENNDGTTGSYGFCPEPTTTSTIFGTSTTTTTATSTTTSTLVTGPSDDRLAGGLLLRMKEGKPAKSKLRLQTIEALGEELTLGRGPGSLDDPTLHGGRLLVFSSVSGAFVNEYALDTTTGGWVPKRKHGQQVGYVFKGNGAIKKVTITDSRWLTAKGKGEALNLRLGATDPSPVGVILEIGEHRYCLEFTAMDFKPNKLFRDAKQPEPPMCPTVPD